jgi:hypothetical protein
VVLGALVKFPSPANRPANALVARIITLDPVVRTKQKFYFIHKNLLVIVNEGMLKWSMHPATQRQPAGGSGIFNQGREISSLI